MTWEQARGSERMSHAKMWRRALEMVKQQVEGPESVECDEQRAELFDVQRWHSPLGR